MAGQPAMEGASPAPARRRPGWVWFIFLYTLLSILILLPSTYLIWSGRVPLDADTQQYFRAWGPVRWSLSVLFPLARVIGVVLLFRLRKSSLIWLSGALVANFLYSLWGIFHGDLLRVTTLFAVVMGWVYWLLVCRYASRLIDRGVLT